MNHSQTFHGLRFERPNRTVPRRLVVIVGSVVLFALLWWLLPPSLMFWFVLLIVAVLTWMASYGWREAVVVLIALLHRLEEA
jgi:uncharacterized protein (DUF983 family)